MAQRVFIRYVQTKLFLRISVPPSQSLSSTNWVLILELARNNSINVGKKVCAEFMIGNNISAHQRATKETPFSSEWPPEVRLVLERALTVLEEVLDSATTQQVDYRSKESPKH